MKKKIIVSVITNIETDQRVIKTCRSLFNNDFEVILIGSTYKGKPNLDFPFKTELISLWNKSGFLLFLEFNLKLFFSLLFKSKKNAVLLSNDLDTLLPNFLISKLFNLKLVFDSHEIFSELPSHQGKKNKKRIWKTLEQSLIPRIKYFYTVSDSYAKWFEKEYDNKPLVIRNVPLKEVHSCSVFKEIKGLPIKTMNEKVIIYQGIIGKERGIDKMILAMQHIENVQLWIVGYGAMEESYKRLSQEWKVNNKVYFLGKRMPEELKEITKKADLGLSIEEDSALSYQYALPNKLFDYIHAGIPILGSNLPEIENIISKYNIGSTIKSHSPLSISSAVKGLLSEDKNQYKKNLETAANDLCWNEEGKILLSIFDQFKI